MEKIIVRKMIEDGLMAKVIFPRLNENGLVAEIGENWFYFGGTEFEFTDPRDIPFSILVEEIKVVLDSFVTHPQFKDEYMYYYDYLCEHI